MELSNVEVSQIPFISTLIDSDYFGKFSYEAILIKNFAKRSSTTLSYELLVKLDIAYHTSLCIMKYAINESSVFIVLFAPILDTRVFANVSTSTSESSFRIIEEVFFRGSCVQLLLQPRTFARYEPSTTGLAKVHLSRKRNSLIAHEDELVIMIPTILLGIHSGLQLLGVAPGGAGAAATRQSEALLLQHVEGLFDDAVLQKKA